MADESYSFSTARARLEDIVSEVRKKDTSLEKSLDLLEEGVRLANQCTELIDQQDWTNVTAPESAGQQAPEDRVADSDAEAVVLVEDVVVSDENGEVVAVAESVEVVELDRVPDFAEADDAWADESGLDEIAAAEESAESEG
jgi:exodeoxyribonuclease VII small subunit